MNRYITSPKYFNRQFTSDTPNFKKFPMSSYRRFSYTLHNYTDEDEANIKAIDGYKYHVYGREVCPETGRKHLQGFIILKNKVTWHTAKNLFPATIHIEATKKSTADNVKYCKKDKNFWEAGIQPLSPGESEIERWKQARHFAKLGQWDDIPDDIYIRHYGNLRRIYSDNQRIPFSVSDLDFHWYWGPTGTGKSTKARNDNPDYYLKGINKWWDGYDNQAVVIIEEWGPMDPGAERIMGHYLKQWCDHHPFQAEYKGGMKMIRPTRIIITSNYPLEECFHDEGILEPLKRRLHIEYFHNFFPRYPPIQVQQPAPAATPAPSSTPAPSPTQPAEAPPAPARPLRRALSPSLSDYEDMEHQLANGGVYMFP